MTKQVKVASTATTNRGEYRSIYVALVDDPDFQDLSAEARSIIFVLKLKLGLSGIGVFMEETLPRYTGIPSERVSKGFSELIAKDWLRVERNVFWLRNGLKFDPSNPLASKNHRTGIINHIATLPKLAIVNEFARHYGLEEPFDLGPSPNGSGRVPKGFPNGSEYGDTVHRTPDVKKTEAEASEAAPRIESEQEGEPEDVAGETPPPSLQFPTAIPPRVQAEGAHRAAPDRNAIRAAVAPAIREHLWLGNTPPPVLAKSDPGWNMGRELSIATGFVERGEATLEEMVGAIECARPALAMGQLRPLSMKIFNVKDRHDRLQVAVAHWRRQEAKRRREMTTPADLAPAIFAHAMGGRHVEA